MPRGTGVAAGHLVEHARHVVAHRLLGQRERGGDLGIVESACNALEHLALSFGEVAQLVFDAFPRTGRARDDRFRQRRSARQSVLIDPPETFSFAYQRPRRHYVGLPKRPPLG